MSYDVYVVHEATEDSASFDYHIDNYTSNVFPAYERAFIGVGNPADQRKGLNRLDGLDTHEAVYLLAEALADMTEDEGRDFYRDMDPTNDWGNYEGAVAFLARILAVAVLADRGTTIMVSA